jgi:hypothetical protein
MLNSVKVQVMLQSESAHITIYHPNRGCSNQQRELKGRKQQDAHCHSLNEGLSALNALKKTAQQRKR